MDRESWSDTTIIQIIWESFNVAVIDGDVDSNVYYFEDTISIDSLKKIYKITGYPTTIILERNGVYKNNIRGYMGKDNFEFILNKLRDGFYD